MHPQARGCESMTLIQHKHQFGNSATRGGDETRRYHAYLLSVAQLGAYDTAPGMSRSICYGYVDVVSRPGATRSSCVIQDIGHIMNLQY